MNVHPWETELVHCVTVLVYMRKLCSHKKRPVNLFMYHFGNIANICCLVKNARYRTVYMICLFVKKCFLVYE